MLKVLSYLSNQIPTLAGLIFLISFHGPALATDKASEAAIPFAAATVHFEQNATDGDVEVVFEVKGGQAGLSKLDVISPDGRKVIDFTAPDASTLGIRQFSFESPEPKDIESLKSAYPEGMYTFAGTTLSGRKLTGQSRLNHSLPSTATIIQPVPHGGGVVADEVTITWSPLKNITGTIIEIQQDELGVSIKAKLPGSANAFTVPAGFLAPGKEYELAIGTVSEDGNIVFVETTFTTTVNK